VKKSVETKFDGGNYVNDSQRTSDTPPRIGLHAQRNPPRSVAHNPRDVFLDVSDISHRVYRRYGTGLVCYGVRVGLKILPIRTDDGVYGTESEENGAEIDIS